MLSLTLTTNAPVLFDDSAIRVYRIDRKSPPNRVVRGLTIEQERHEISKEKKEARQVLLPPVCPLIPLCASSIGAAIINRLFFYYREAKDEAKRISLAKAKAKADARKRKIAAARAKHAALVEQEQNQRCAKALRKLEAAKRRC